MSKDFSYPLPDDDNFASKIYNKREYYAQKIERRKELIEYKDIKKYRDNICEGDFELRPQQALLRNFISPDTPYKGLLVMHGTGVGKTCTAISIAEQFKDQVKKYNTKIYVLVPGTAIKENFKEQLLTCTGETYLKNRDLLQQMSKVERDREEKIATYSSLQYYKILSYKTFYKKVLGEKIVEKKVDNNNKIKTSYKKDKTGNIERELVVDKIVNMDNSIIIIDEAHNLTGNEYGEALKKIIKASNNLKIVLLSATPMKNLAADIIDLLNFIRPQDKPIRRDMVFTSDNSYKMEIKPSGTEYLKKMTKGYISYFRGNLPFLFADRIDKGEIPDELLFTPLVRCLMQKFQLTTYTTTKEEADDTLERSSSAVANFVFPGLNSEKTKLKGLYSTEGLNKFFNEFNNNKDLILRLINSEIYNNKINKDDLNNFIKESENKNLSGLILNLKYLKQFSIKFYECIINLKNLVDGKNGSGTSFIYSNLVKAGGIELFAECLKENGYLEYNEDIRNYNIQDNTIDAITGKTFIEFKKDKKNINLFYPASYLLYTGSNEDGDDIPEIKLKTIRTIFNNIENKNGKLLKIVLGSKVMTEGVTLANVKEVHILDVPYTLGKVEQVIGRAIRWCKHKDLINDDYKFPKVNVYRYVITQKRKLTSDENLYRKGELKWLLIKKIEHIIRSIAIDCPLLLYGNKFPEEIKKYKNCKYPTLENKRKGEQLCPQICNFEECDFKCDDKILNNKYYDKNMYKDLTKKDIDYNTFNDNLANSEIKFVKSIIKDLYRFNYVYIYDEILKNINFVLNNTQKEMFDNYFLDKGLKDMMPKTENDFNNYTDTIIDKYNRSGYLIQRSKYYIFQPFDENEDLPIYYRKNKNINTTTTIKLQKFLKNKYGEIKQAVEKKNVKIKYDFNTNKEYYKKRNENDLVGIIDQNKEGTDVFKIRPKITKVSNKKRGTGIYSLTGAVCATSKDKEYLIKQLKKIDKNIKIPANLKRSNICEIIKNTLLKLEKYSTSKDKNKLTYIIIPNNHKEYEFPYNLEDRIKYIIKNIFELIKNDFKHQVKKGKKYYDIEITVNKFIQNNIKEIEDMGFKLKNKLLIKRIE